MTTETIQKAWDEYEAARATLVGRSERTIILTRLIASLNLDDEALSLLPAAAVHAMGRRLGPDTNTVTDDLFSRAEDALDNLRAGFIVERGA